MLLVADRGDLAAEAVITTGTYSEPVAAAPSPSTGRYGEGRRPNLPAMALAAVIPAILFALAIQAGVSIVRKAQPRLVVLNLMPPPPPPSSAPAVPKTTPRTRPVATTPVVVPQIPVPAPLSAPAAVPAPQPPAPPAQSQDPAPAAPTAPASPAPPSTVKANDLGTRMISAVAPAYPMESRRKREQGTVVLSLILDLAGRVSSISVARSSGFDRLDDAALKAVRKWRWAPITRGGQPVMVKGEVEIPFVLKA